MIEEQKACIDCKGIVCVQLEDRRVMGNLKTNQITEIKQTIKHCPLRKDFKASDWEEENHWWNLQGKIDTKNLGS